jgi:hypothetical protein
MPHTPHSPSTAPDELARVTAARLDDTINLEKYAAYCRKYPEGAIRRALAGALSARRKCRSRAALFFYLAKRYAHQPSYHPRP